MKKILSIGLALLLFSSLCMFIAPVSAHSEQIPGHFEWSKGDVVPTAGKVIYEISFIPDDTENYDIVTAEIEINIAKATPKSEEDETWDEENVTAIAFAKRGTLIKDVEISDYNIYDVDGNILPGTWEWKNSDVEIHSEGVYPVVFVPDDTNYEELNTKVYVKIKSGGSSGEVRYNVVTYDVGDYGKIAENYRKTEKVKYGETVKDIPLIDVDEGYKHIGWEINGETIDPYSFMVKEKVTLKAVYIPINKIKYLQGYDGYIYPDNPLTRAEAATLFARISGWTDDGHSYSVTFSDVNNDEWYAESIKFVAEKSIVFGFEDGTFRPDEYITRAELSTMIYRYLNLSSTAKSHFTDVTAHWSERYVAVLESLKFINGYEDGTFRPDDNVTRAETVKCLNKMLGIDSLMYEIENPNFKDIDETHWAFKEIAVVTYNTKQEE